MGNAGLRPDPQKQLGKRMKKAGREVLSIVLLSHDPPLPRPNNKHFFSTFSFGRSRMEKRVGFRWKRANERSTVFSKDWSRGAWEQNQQIEMKDRTIRELMLERY